MNVSVSRVGPACSASKCPPQVKCDGCEALVSVLAAGPVSCGFVAKQSASSAITCYARSLSDIIGVMADAMGTVQACAGPRQSSLQPAAALAPSLHKRAHPR